MRIVPHIHVPIPALPELPRIPRQERSRRKRDALLAAALPLFGERGYDAVTSEDIAEAAGVSVGTFYAYFRNKKQVLLTLVAAYKEQVLHLGLDALDLAPSPPAAIEAAIRRVLTEEQPYAGLRRAFAEAAASDRSLAEYEAQQRAEVQERLAGVIERSRGLPGARPGVDTRAAALAITALVQRLRDWPLADVDAVAHTAARMIYHLLFADTAPEAPTGSVGPAPG